MFGVSRARSPVRRPPSAARLPLFLEHKNLVFLEHKNPMVLERKNLGTQDPCVLGIQERRVLGVQEPCILSMQESLKSPKPGFAHLLGLKMVFGPQMDICKDPAVEQ